MGRRREKSLDSKKGRYRGETSPRAFNSFPWKRGGRFHEDAFLIIKRKEKSSERMPTRRSDSAQNSDVPCQGRSPSIRKKERKGDQSSWEEDGIEAPRLPKKGKRPGPGPKTLMKSSRNRAVRTKIPARKK